MYSFALLPQKCSSFNEDAPVWVLVEPHCAIRLLHISICWYIGQTFYNMDKTNIVAKCNQVKSFLFQTATFMLGNATQILERFKKRLNLKTDQDVANLLGKDRSTITGWKSRDSLDLENIINHCQPEDLAYILTGNEVKAVLQKSTLQADNKVAKIETLQKRIEELETKLEYATEIIALGGTQTEKPLVNRVEYLENSLETLQRFVQRIVFREGGADLLEEPPTEEPEGSNVHSVVYIKGTPKEKTDKPQEEHENERA